MCFLLSFCTGAGAIRAYSVLLQEKASTQIRDRLDILDWTCKYVQDPNSFPFSLVIFPFFFLTDYHVGLLFREVVCVLCFVYLYSPVTPCYIHFLLLLNTFICVLIKFFIVPRPLSTAACRPSKFQSLTTWRLV